jgi:hypothetical protein
VYNYYKQQQLLLQQVLQALNHYKKLYTSLEIAPDFEVPYDYEWPRDLAEMRLGVICDQMRCGDIDARANPERKAALDAIGFPWREVRVLTLITLTLC